MSYTVGLRRIPAVIVLLASLFGWAAPGLFALLEDPARAPEGRLPACCRRDGKHRCAMLDASKAKPSNGPAFRSGGRCPYYPSSVPAAVVFPSQDGIAPPMAVSAEVLRRPDSSAKFPSVPRPAPGFGMAACLRGPPCPVVG